MDFPSESDIVNTSFTDTRERELAQLLTLRLSGAKPTTRFRIVGGPPAPFTENTSGADWHARLTESHKSFELWYEWNNYLLTMAISLPGNKWEALWQRQHEMVQAWKPVGAFLRAAERKKKRVR